MEHHRTLTVSPRFLTQCYIAALAVIALLSIASHVVLSEALRANEGSAAIINDSGRQRMLSQRIVGLAAELIAGDMSARRPLVDATADFERAHAHLVALLPTTAGSERDQLEAIYFGAATIDRRMAHFASAAERIAARGPRDTRPLLDDTDFKSLVSEARGPLLVGLDKAVKIHQAASESRSRQLISIQWAILAIVLVTLLVEAMFIFRPMVTRLADYVRALLRLADGDYLTGLANRRAFTDQSIRAIEHGRRHEHPASLLLIDVDHFKAINDTHGHPGGDTVLVELAECLRLVVRASDIVGRIGGEEFAILLPETSPPQAAAMAERVRESVAALRIPIDGEDVSPTISIGMAGLRFHQADPLAAAMKTADAMLYRAKQAGRNQVWPALELQPPEVDRRVA